MGRTGPLVEPRRGPQAGKSGDPRSQDADREDIRSILTVLLLHFISGTRVEQVANKVYRASQGWRPGCLDWDAEAGSFSHQHG